MTAQCEAAIDEWFLDHKVPDRRRATAPLTAHPAYVRKDDVLGIGFISDAALLAHHAGKNLKIMAAHVVSAKLGTIRIKPVQVYWSGGPRDSTPCVYFFRFQDGTYAEWVGAHESDVAYAVKSTAPKLLDPDAPLDPPPPPGYIRKLIQVGSAVRVLLNNKRVRRRVLKPNGFGLTMSQCRRLAHRFSMGRQADPGWAWLYPTTKPGQDVAVDRVADSMYEKSNRLTAKAGLSEAFSHIWFLGSLFAEFFVWSALEEGHDLSVWNFGNMNHMYIFFSMFQPGGHPFSKKGGTLRGEVAYLQVKYEEFVKLHPPDATCIGRLAGVPALGNVFKDFGSKFSTNLEVYCHFERIKANVVQVVRSADPSLDGPAIEEMLTGVATSTNRCIQGCAVLWTAFHAAVKLNYPSALGDTGDEDEGNVKKKKAQAQPPTDPGVVERKGDDAGVETPTPTLAAAPTRGMKRKSTGDVPAPAAVASGRKRAARKPKNTGSDSAPLDDITAPLPDSSIQESLPSATDEQKEGGGDPTIKKRKAPAAKKWSKFRYNYEVISLRWRLKALLAEWDTPREVPTKATGVSASDDGAVESKKEASTSASTTPSKRRRRRRLFARSVEARKDDCGFRSGSTKPAAQRVQVSSRKCSSVKPSQGRATRRRKRRRAKQEESSLSGAPPPRPPKQFSLVPHGSPSRTFMRLDRTTLTGWNKSNTVFRGLAKELHVKYSDGAAPPLEAGTYIGGSLLTNGYELHVVVASWDWRWVSPPKPKPKEQVVADPAGAGEGEEEGDGGDHAGGPATRSRPTACSHLVDTRNMAAFVAGKPGVYCGFDVGQTPAAVEAFRKAADACEVSGCDPGKLYPVTAVNMRGELFRVSQKQYYHVVSNRNKPDTHPMFASKHVWSKRKVYGFVPEYVRAAWTGLHSRKPFTLAKFKEALTQLGEKAPRNVPPVLTAASEAAVPLRPARRPEGCESRVQAMWQHALCSQVAVRRFRAYQRKQRMMMWILRHLGPHKGWIILMGCGYDGSVHQRSSTGMPAPIKYIIRYLGRHCRVVMVPEYRTTQACFECRDKPFVAMEAVIDGVSGKVVHGSKYCPQCKKRVNRDLNAARNILEAGVRRIVGGTALPSLSWWRGEQGFAKVDPWRVPLHGAQAARAVKAVQRFQPTM